MPVDADMDGAHEQLLYVGRLYVIRALRCLHPLLVMDAQEDFEEIRRISKYQDKRPQ